MHVEKRTGSVTHPWVMLYRSRRSSKNCRQPHKHKSHAFCPLMTVKSKTTWHVRKCPLQSPSPSPSQQPEPTAAKQPTQKECTSSYHLRFGLISTPGWTCVIVKVTRFQESIWTSLWISKGSKSQSWSGLWWHPRPRVRCARARPASSTETRMWNGWKINVRGEQVKYNETEHQVWITKKTRIGVNESKNELQMAISKHNWLEENDQSTLKALDMRRYYHSIYIYPLFTTTQRVVVYLCLSNC